MRDLLLQGAGALTIVVALIHGYLGEAKVFARATIEPARLRTLIHWSGRPRPSLDRRRRAADRGAPDGLETARH